MLSRLLRSSLSWYGLPQDVHTTRRARLLTLEPRAETVGVEYVCARKLLARRCHVLATNNANVITWKYKQHVTRKVIRSASTCTGDIHTQLEFRFLINVKTIRIESGCVYKTESPDFFVSIITARKRSCGKVMFLPMSVILFTGGLLSGRRPPRQRPPLNRDP